MKVQKLRSLLVAAVCAFLFSAAAFAPSFAEDATPSPADLSNPLRNLPKLDASKARIFFFRPDRYVGLAADARLRINGKTVGWVGSGSAVFVDYVPGDAIIGIGGSDGYGHDFSLTLQAGQEYFITVAAEANACCGIIPALANVIIDSHIDQQHCENGWCAGVVDKAAALPEFQNLSISGPNPDAD